MAKNIVNPFLKRYPPNNRFSATGFASQIEQICNYEVFGDSITDKESYRLNLVSMRGEMSKMAGSNSKGVYMFEDGKYDKSKDYSVALRPDISLVQLDEVIEKLSSELEIATKEQKKQIQQELDKAQMKKTELVAQQTSSVASNSAE